MSKKLPRCSHCLRAFRPDRYNAHRQEFCARPECVLERRRLRQREYHARRRASDPQFAARENARCAAANRRRRAAASAARGDPPEGDAGYPVVLTHVVTGLLAQLADTGDPVLLRDCLRRYGDRGRQPALEFSLGSSG